MHQNGYQSFLALSNYAYFFTFPILQKIVDHVLSDEIENGSCELENK